MTSKPDFNGLDPETGEPWSPRKIASLLGLRAVNDEQEIRRICEQVVELYPGQALSYRSGKTKLLGFFIKEVMAWTKNGADPKITDRVLRELLAGL